MNPQDKGQSIRSRYLAAPEQTRRQVELELVQKAIHNDAFRQELLLDPRATIEREIGHRFRRNLRVQIMEETENTIFIVLPYQGRDRVAPPGYKLLREEGTRGGMCGPDDTLLIPVDGVYAITYEDRNFQGHACVFYNRVYRANRGEFYDMRNDQISSVKVGSHAILRMCEHEGDDGQGAGLTVIYAPGNEVPYVGDAFNDKCSYVEVVRTPSVPWPKGADTLPAWAREIVAPK